jgi:hypothetical protein
MVDTFQTNRPKLKFLAGLQKAAAILKMLGVSIM